MRYLYHSRTVRDRLLAFKVRLLASGSRILSAGLITFSGLGGNPELATVHPIGRVLEDCPPCLSSLHSAIQTGWDIEDGRHRRGTEHLELCGMRSNLSSSVLRTQALHIDVTQ